MAVDGTLPFEFEGRTYSDIVKLAEAMGMNWQKGRQALFSGKVGDYFKRIDRSIYTNCQNAEQEYHAEPKNGDVIFLKWLCKVKGLKNLYWMGRNFGGVSQITMLLRKGYDAEFNPLLNYMVREQLFSVFVKNSGADQVKVDNVHYLERCYVKKDSMFNKKNIAQLMYYVLSDTRTFNFEGKTYRRETDFAKYLQECADKSRSLLESKIDMLFVDQYNLTPAFEGWLINLGKLRELSLWRDKYQTGLPEDEDEEEFVFQEDVEEQEQAQKQTNEDFSKDIYGFEIDFIKMLTDYPDSLQAPKKFEALLRDLFPEKPLQIYLLLTLYKMDIASAIQNASELDDVFTLRFIKRMKTDFGVKEEFAKWAASVWCVCYGEKILQKRNRVSVYKVL